MRLTCDRNLVIARLRSRRLQRHGAACDHQGAHPLDGLKLDDLLALDAALNLNSEEATAACLSNVLQAKDAGLISAALGDLACAPSQTQAMKAPKPAQTATNR